MRTQGYSADQIKTLDLIEQAKDLRAHAFTGRVQLLDQGVLSPPLERRQLLPSREQRLGDNVDGTGEQGLRTLFGSSLSDF